MKLTFSSRTRPWRSAVAVLVVAGFLTACTAGGSGNSSAGTAGQSSAAGASDRTLVWADKGQVPTLDPARSDYQQTDVADQLFYDALVGYDSNSALVGRLADKYQYSADAKSLTITLHKDVKFHDGTVLTSTDVAYTLDRLKKIGTGYATHLKSYQSTEITNDQQFTIRLSQPDALFLAALARVYILNSKLVTKNQGTDNGQSWLATHDAGSGPYTLAKVESGRIEGTRFAGYWEFRANRPNTFVLRQIDDSTARSAAVVSGEVTVASVDSTTLGQLKKDASIKIQQSAVTFLQEIYFNNSHGVTANPAVREAVRYAFDYQGALDKIEGGIGSIARSGTPPPCRPSLPAMKQDLDKAKQVLAAAGVKNLTLKMLYQPAFPDQEQEATLLQSNLKQIGVTLDLEPIAYPAYQTLLNDWKQIPEMMLSRNVQSIDPGPILQQQYLSTSIGTNYAAYSNPAVDKLITTALGTADDTQRCDLYKQAFTAIDADFATMPLLEQPRLIAYHTGVVGIDSISANGGPSMREFGFSN